MLKRAMAWVRERFGKPQVVEPVAREAVIVMQPVPVTHFPQLIRREPQPKKWTRDEIEVWRENVRRCDELHRQLWAGMTA